MPHFIFDLPDILAGIIGVLALIAALANASTAHLARTEAERANSRLDTLEGDDDPASPPSA